MIRALTVIAVCGVGLGATPSRAAERLTGDHVQISWLAPERFGRGEETVGVVFTPEPGWHLYWHNPGDSGAAPKLAFFGDARIGPVQWPYPARLPNAHLTNLGYPGETALLIPIRPSDAEHVRLSAQLEWLVCKEDECVPGFGTLTLERPRQETARWSAERRGQRDAVLRRIPKPMREAPWELVSAVADAQSVNVTLRDKTPGAPIPEAYPTDGAFLDPRAPEPQRSDDGFLLLRFTRLSTAVSAPTTTGFVFVADTPDGGRAWYANDVHLSEAAAAPSEAPSEAPLPLVLVLAMAFLGGLLLNLMPCVLPVLSLKLLALAQTPRGEQLREALLYTAGVVTTFLALGGLALALQAAGEAIGWGFQLQSPVVVLGLAVLFWLLALNLLGVFDFGFGLMNVAGRARASSAFVTGALSVFVAAPCTGPFMGTALGATVSLPAPLALAVFLALGLGLASPFVALALTPKVSARLPKPGAWMERLKQFLAFPLLGTVVWLAWVLGAQVGTEGWLVIASVILVVSFALWLARGGGRVWVAVAWLVGLVGVGLGAQRLLAAPNVAATSQSAVFAPYDPQAVAAARQAGKPVFIDFTASWCITCQVNKQAVLTTDAALALFRAHDVQLFAADWTRRDPLVTQALAEFGRNSVPLYVYYPPSGAPQVLPQLLTLATLEALF